MYSARHHSQRSLSLRILSAFLFLAAALAASAEARVVVKMPTLAPEGSVWAKIFKEMGAEWQESTDGEVSLRMYAGGVAGDEPDVVRKMRIGQLHAAVLTVVGMSVIDKGFEVFEIPMFFESYEELFHVQTKMRPIYEGSA